MENYLNKSILNNLFITLNYKEIVFYPSKAFIANTHTVVGHPQPPLYFQPVL